MYGYREKSALSSVGWDSWNRAHQHDSLPFLVEHGLHVWREVVLVSQHRSLYMATKYMLDIYYIVRLLLVYGETTVEKRAHGIWRRIACDGSDDRSDATEQGCFWCVDLYRFLYVVTYSIG